MGHARTGQGVGLLLLVVFGYAASGVTCELPVPDDTTKAHRLYRLDGAKSLVWFHAKAFMHDFVGKTSKMQAAIRLSDLERFTDAEACVRIDAASLDTDNSVRDGIMREEHLETAKFPTIDFMLKQVEAPKREDNGWEFTARGTLSLHGVSREILLPVRARQDGDAVRLTSGLPLKMTDYRMRIPKFLFFTVEDQVVVSFDITARRIQ